MSRPNIRNSVLDKSWAYGEVFNESFSNTFFSHLIMKYNQTLIDEMKWPLLSKYIHQKNVSKWFFPLWKSLLTFYCIRNLKIAKGVTYKTHNNSICELQNTLCSNFCPSYLYANNLKNIFYNPIIHVECRSILFTNQKFKKR